MILIAKIILWFLFVFGGSYVTSQSEMGREFRELFNFKKMNLFKKKLSYLVNCIICSSFYWAILATFIFSPAALLTSIFVLQLFVNGIIAIGFTFVLYKLIPKDLFE